LESSLRRKTLRKEVVAMDPLKNNWTLRNDENTFVSLSENTHDFRTPRGNEWGKSPRVRE